MVELLEQSEALIFNVSLDFKRYLSANIEWNSRLIGIKGARGTGKTTMLLQWLREKELPVSQAAYFTMDDIYFSNNSLVETAKRFYKQGGEILVLDEVHKYPNWSREIKNLYDLLPKLQIVFTGSSIIDITKQEGDLSSRALIYELHGLSYREYLKYTGVLDVEPIKLKQVLDASSKRSLFPNDFKPLVHFKDYLNHGYYPYFTESKIGYHQKLRQLVRTVVEYDMAEIKGLDIRNAKKLLQLIYIISQQVPFKPNLSKLAEKCNIHRNSINSYIHYLDQASILSLLYPSGKSIATLQKPEKIFLNNTNLLYALTSEQPSNETVREVFFHNQVGVKHRISYPKKGDFLIDDNFLFEVGGKNKSTAQIKDQQEAWVVKDDLEYVVGNSIPLWLFGFLY